MSLTTRTNAHPLTHLTTFDLKEKAHSIHFKQSDVSRYNVILDEIFKLWQPKFRDVNLSPLKRVLIEHIQIRQTDSGNMVYVSSEIHHALFKPRGYFSRLFSGESWESWKEDRTSLGQVVREIGNCVEGSSPSASFKRLGNQALLQANKEALELIQSKELVSTSEKDPSCMENVALGLLGSIAMQSSLPTLLGVSSCLPSIKADDAVNPIPNQLVYINEPKSIKFDLYDVFGVNDTSFCCPQFEMWDGSPLPSWIFIGWNYDTPDQAWDVTISGGFAYVADDDKGLQIIDVTNPSQPKLKGSYDTPSRAWSIAISGSVVYLADGGSGLQIIDVTNPALPKLKGNYVTLSWAHCVAVSEDFAYIANDDKGLQIIDVSDPAQPKFKGNYVTPAGASRVAVSEGVAYVAYGDHFMLEGLQIIDVTDPSQPKLKGSYNTLEEVSDIAISGSVVYVADGHGLKMIDVSDPTQPRLSGNYDTPGRASSVAISGSFAFVTDYEKGLQIIDVSDPALPKLKGNYNTPGLAYGVSVSGSFAYVADGTRGLQIIGFKGVAGPLIAASLSERGLYTLHVSFSNGAQILNTTFTIAVSERVSVKNKQSAESIALSEYGKLLSISFYPEQLFTSFGVKSFLNFSSTSFPCTFQPTLSLATYNTPGWADSVTVSGSFAYVADGDSGLQIIDVSDPTQPKLKGSYDTSGRVYDVTVLGNFAYVADDTTGLQIIDVSDPAQPKLKGNYNTPGQAFGVAVSGGFAYVADWDKGLQIIDVTNPALPKLKGNYDTQNAANGVAISGSIAYVADGDSGIQIIDVTDPALPKLKGNYDTLGFAVDVVVSGGFAYVADGNSGLQIIDVTNPALPKLKGNYNTPGEARGVVISGSFAYVADGGSGLQIIDVSNPALPKLKESYDTPGNANRVVFSGNIAYVADGGVGGLQIMDFSKLRYELSFTPDASIAGNYEWTLIGSNDLGVSAESIFSFRIEGAPLVTGTLPIQVAFVDRIFSSVVSQGVFTDPNHDALTFEARQTGGSLLPKWLDFSPTGVFLGTPGGSDVGFLNISINANDGHMGQASIDMGLTVTHAPTVVKPIPNQLADVGVPFSYLVDKGTFIDLDQDAMTYASRLNTGQPLPSWLKFDPSTLLFSGTPIGFSSLDIEVQAIESHGGKTSTYFNLLAENFPKGVKQIPDLLVGIQVPFSYQLPTDLFIDADGDSLTYHMTDSQGNSIPNWLSFNPLALTLSGTPIAAPSPLKLKLIARDRYGAEGDLDWNLIIDYFPSLNPKYTLPKQVVNLGAFWQLSLPTDLFIDQDDPTLTLTATQNALPLSSWISFQNNLFSGTPETLSKSTIKITAMDSKGAKASSSFDLTVDQFPKVLETPPQVIAAIGKPFSYTLPSNTFDATSLTFKAMQLKSDQRLQALESIKDLPLWLKFDEGKRLFTGTPAPSDAGNMTIQVTATDIEGGYATVLFPIYTTYVPTFEKKIPDMQAKVGHFFNWRLGNGTLINLSNRNTTLELEQVQGPLNHWLTLEGEELFGTPNGSDIGVTQMNLVANDGIAVTKDPFTVEVIDNQSPQFASRMSDQLIEVLEPFQFSLPSVMFKDEDGDPLALSVTMQDGSPIPEWIKFNKKTLTFSGIAPRDATNNFSVKEYEFLVSASDGQKSTDGSFRLKVGGASTLQKVLEYVGYGLTALSFIVAAYRKRALIWKFLGKKIYTAPVEHIMIGREVNYPLSKRVVACFVLRMDDQQEIPISEFFDGELRFDGKERSIRGNLSLDNRGEYTIVAYNWFGVRSRLFVINVDTEEELNKMVSRWDGKDPELGIELQEIKIDPKPQLALKEPVSEEKIKAAKVIQRAWRQSNQKVKPWNMIND